jgi:osmotically inducible protein OsmC
MTLEPLYTAVVEVTGGRHGSALIADHPTILEMTAPLAMGGSGNGFNSEQLFAAAFGACFGAALDLEARQQGIALAEITVAPHVSIGHGDDGYFALSIAVHVHLPELDSPIAERLIALAHNACPYSRMIQGNMEIEFVLQQCQRD